MLKFQPLFTAVLFMTLLFSCTQAPPTVEPTQMIVVLTPEWEAHTGTMQRYERQTPQSRWIRIGKSIPVVVGRNGMAWGRGLHPANEAPPRKIEGDGCSPAGMFSLGKVFGYAAPEDMKQMKMPYMQATETLRCVDDVDSGHYNQIIDQEAVSVDWHSAEIMRRDDDVYRLGVVVEHNTRPCEPGGGSCIFLHIWRDADTGTAGCTAMAPEHMEILVRWLEPEKNPILVQLPGFVYNEMRESWGLP